MQLQLKWLLLFTGMIFALNHLPVSWARPTNPTKSTMMGAVSSELSSTTATAPTNSIDHDNDHDSAGGAADHIIRRRQVVCPPEPHDLNVLHAPCDMDSPELSKYIETLPNQCICAYNSRHNSENDYRKFKILQLEAFFFGQYSERFKRFETDAFKFEH